MTRVGFFAAALVSALAVATTATAQTKVTVVEVFGLRVETAGPQPHLDAARLAFDGEA